MTFLRFARSQQDADLGLPRLPRWMWLKLRWRGRLQTDGLCFMCPGVKFEIGKRRRHAGPVVVVGHGCKVRAHEGEVSIGAKSVLGQECTISASSTSRSDASASSRTG